MSEKPVIIGFGELLWDLLPAGAQLGGAPGKSRQLPMSLAIRGSCGGREA